VAWKALKTHPQFTKVRLAELLGNLPISPPGSSSPALGTTSAPSAKDSEIVEKLRRIQVLKESGLNTPEEAEQRREEILDRAFQ
jgi:hypothetical protein